MKAYIKVIFFLAIILFAMKSYGQRWKNDPSYSAHNYKHPNKGSAARKADTSKVTSIQYVDALVPVNHNYKAQNKIVKRETRKVLVISEPSKEDRVNRNYKQQFAPIGRRKE